MFSKKFRKNLILLIISSLILFFLYRMAANRSFFHCFIFSLSSVAFLRIVYLIKKIIKSIAIGNDANETDELIEFFEFGKKPLYNVVIFPVLFGVICYDIIGLKPSLAISVLIVSFFIELLIYLRLEEDAPRPGRVIGKHTNEIDVEYINKYKSIIVPHPFDFGLYESYLKENFDYEDITDNQTESNQIHLEIFRNNVKACFPQCSKIEPVFVEVKRNNKSKDLYSNLNDKETIYIYMDKGTGYFETNSDFLSYKLNLIRGVSKEEYEQNSPQLMHLITVMCRGENT